MTPQERAGLMIRRAIERSGLSQAEIARAAGISKPHMSNLAKGHYDVRITTLFRIIAACGLEVVELRVHKVAKNSNEPQKVYPLDSQA